MERERNKADAFKKSFGGKVYDSYEKIVKSADIDCIYIPLPPALHYKWAKLALEEGKHVLLEKPATLSVHETQTLVSLARKKNLVLHENYMFLFHSQIEYIDELIESGEIGDKRITRINFGFPLREKEDFRYKKCLGGGALFDAGGYTLKYAQHLLGEDAYIVCSHMNGVDGFEVDMYGSATLMNKDGAVVNVAYGMDNNYKCELEIWCSKGNLYTDRILTAPVGYKPRVVIRKGNVNEEVLIDEDDTFFKSIRYFLDCIENTHERNLNYNNIVKQAELVEQFLKYAK